jgi:hypothetical protein
MAVVRFGDAGPVAGLTAETTGFAQTFANKVTYDEATVDNNIGEVVTFGLFNKRWEGSIELIDKAAATLPSPATAVAAANLSGTYGDPAKIIIVDYERKPEQKGFQKHTFNFKAFANITP